MAEESLVAKLAAACDAVGGVEKKGRNLMQNYDYVKAADVAKAIRHELFKRGILIIPDETEIVCNQIEFQNAKGETRRTTEVRLKVDYNITDGANTIVSHAYGIAWDSGDKAIYKAKTGALKYFLRGLGLIPDEKDDPEYEIPGRSTEKGEGTINPTQQRAFWAAVTKSGKTKLQVQDWINTVLSVQTTKEIHKDDFDMAMKWAVAPIKPPATSEEMQDALSRSVEAIRTREPGEDEEIPSETPEKPLASPKLRF